MRVRRQKRVSVLLLPNVTQTGSECQQDVIRDEHSLVLPADMPKLASLLRCVVLVMLLFNELCEELALE